MSEQRGEGPAPKQTGRRPGPVSSYQAVLAAARREFGTHGYQGTTTRGIATAAGVDTALIHHFFLTKDGLFEAAVGQAFRCDDLPAQIGGDRAQLGERLVAAFLRHWAQPEVNDCLRGVLRSVHTSALAADAVRDLLGEGVLAPVIRQLGVASVERRAALVGAQLVGLATVRYVYRLEPVASLDPQQAAVLLGEVFQRLLVGRL